MAEPDTGKAEEAAPAARPAQPWLDEIDGAIDREKTWRD